MPYGFEQIVCKIPSNLVDIEDLVHSASLSNEVVERLHNNGLRRIPVSDDNPLSTLVNQAVIKLSAAVPDLAERTKGIILAHSIPILAPSDVPFLKMCLKNQGFDSVPSVAVSGQPCAILHMGVQLAGLPVEPVSERLWNTTFRGR